ncbi:hypothetical protein I2750_22690 [Bacillus sp. PR5]|nr:hypothetical protein [Bacillus sp. PR5]
MRNRHLQKRARTVRTLLKSLSANYRNGCPHITEKGVRELVKPAVGRRTAGRRRRPAVGRYEEAGRCTPAGTADGRHHPTESRCCDRRDAAACDRRPVLRPAASARGDRTRRRYRSGRAEWPAPFVR